MSNDATNGYAEVNGLKMYHEVHGSGRWSCCMAPT